jgi:hypothetical protein
MKTYSKQNYNSYEEYAAELTAELSKELKGTFKITSTRTNEVGQAIRPKVCTYSDDIYADINYPTRQVTMSLRRGLNTSIVVDPEIRTIIEKYLAVTKESYEIYDAEEREAYRIQQEQERKAREEKLEKEKFEKRKQAALQKLNSIKPEQTSRLFKTPTSQYEVLGWMAKHTKSIKASMPDYMENWFVKIFGPEADRYVVDSTKRTSGGHPMQWSLSCKISFDSEVPSLLLNKVASNKKAIDSVAFVWDLIDNYGFTFGKTQSYEQIESEIPNQYLEDFRRGYAM